MSEPKDLSKGKVVARAWKVPALLFLLFSVLFGWGLHVYSLYGELGKCKNNGCKKEVTGKIEKVEAKPIIIFKKTDNASRSKKPKSVASGKKEKRNTPVKSEVAKVAPEPVVTTSPHLATNQPTIVAPPPLPRTSTANCEPQSFDGSVAQNFEDDQGGPRMFDEVYSPGGSERYVSGNEEPLPYYYEEELEEVAIVYDGGIGYWQHEAPLMVLDMYGHNRYYSPGYYPVRQRLEPIAKPYRIDARPSHRGRDHHENRRHQRP